jgi:hypothetical protein
MSKKTKRWPKVHAAKSNQAAMIQCTGEATITAGQTGEHVRPAVVDVVAYNGGPLVVAGYDAPVYLDLDGVSGMGKQLPLLRDHDKSRIVGTVTPKRIGNTIEATGKLVGSGDDRKQVEELAADGYAWQASVGARPSKMDRIKAGVKAAVNGATITGPAYIARQSRLAETSIVTIGADADTHVGIAATDPDDDEGGEGQQKPARSQRLAAIVAEQARREAIEASGIAEIEAGGNIATIETMMQSAIENGVSAQTFELQLLRQQRRPQGRISSGGRAELHGRDLEQAVEASLMLHLGDDASSLEKQFPERVLTAMDRHVDLRHGLGLHDLLLFACDRNGQTRVSRRDYRGMLEGAFPVVQASGLSSISVSGILSNIANKALKESFEAVESTWREISDIQSVSDFKTITSYSLTGDMTYNLVPPGGELKHATVGEASFTNAADTYGRMFALDRRDIINDNLGALRAIPRRLGRGGALKLNDVFWAEFLDHASFFHANNSNLIGSGSSAPWYILVDPLDMAVIQVVFLNGKQTPTVESADADFKQLGIQLRGYHDFGVAKQEPRAAVKSPAALSIDAVEAANLLLLNQTDYDDKPLALRGAILLTATGNAVKAKEIFSSLTVLGSTSAKNTSMNPFAGMFRPVYSAYLPNS